MEKIENQIPGDPVCYLPFSFIPEMLSDLMVDLFNSQNI